MVIDGYRVIRRQRAGSVEILLGYNPEKRQPYATWARVLEMPPLDKRLYRAEGDAERGFALRVRSRG